MKLKLEKTKLADEYGRPVDFYHTTNIQEDIGRFHPLTHFGTKQAAKARGIYFAYKILGIPEPALLPKELPSGLKAKLQKMQAKPLKTYQVYLYMKSPLFIFDFGKHELSDYQGWFSRRYEPKSIYLTPKECLERDTVGAEKMAYKKALSEFVFKDPKNLSVEKLKKELASDTLFSPFSNNEKELAKKLSFQRMIRYLETEGYDGFVYKNDCEDIGQRSYIIFRPEQVFKQGEIEHELSLINKENQQFLHKIEDDFFETKGILSPYKRRELNRQIRAKSLNKRTK